MVCGSGEVRRRFCDMDRAVAAAGSPHHPDSAARGAAAALDDGGGHGQAKSPQAQPHAKASRSSPADFTGYMSIRLSTPLDSCRPPAPDEGEGRSGKAFSVISRSAGADATPLLTPPAAGDAIHGDGAMASSALAAPPPVSLAPTTAAALKAMEDAVGAIAGRCGCPVSAWAAVEAATENGGGGAVARSPEVRKVVESRSCALIPVALNDSAQV